MWEKWKDAFFSALSERMQTYTQDNILMKNEVNGEWMLQTIFAANLEKTDFVMLQAIPYQAREDVLLLEIYIRLLGEVKPEAEEELFKAIQELNTFSPVGTFGIYPGGEHVFLRNCIHLDTEGTSLRAVDETVLEYEMMMEGVLAAYEGLTAVWNGTMTFRQAVEQELLKEYSHKNI